MKKMFLLSAVIAAAALFAGCCNHECGKQKTCTQEKSCQITGSWSVEELPAAAAKNLKTAPAAEIIFSENKVNGCAGDNRFFGAVKIDGCTIAFSQMGMTRMMGPNAAFEDCFMKALNETTAFAVENNKLCLKNKDGKTVMVLKLKK